MSPMRAIPYAAGALAVLAACAPPPGDPTVSALAMFDAFLKGDAAGVQRLLDPEGVYLAERKCQNGLAIHCLVYPFPRGPFQSRTARVTRRSSRIATRPFAYVEVKSVWEPATSHHFAPIVLCQEFQVTYLDRQWRIQDFGHVDPCSR
jgi:hypothetical protein